MSLVQEQHSFGFREVGDHELRLMVPPSGFYRFTAWVWEALSVPLHTHCGAHILPQVPSRETALAYSSEADISQIKTPFNICLQNPDCDTTASLSLWPWVKRRAEVAGGFLSVIECQICLALKRDCLMQASAFVNVFSITRERWSGLSLNLLCGKTLSWASTQRTPVICIKSPPIGSEVCLLLSFIHSAPPGPQRLNPVSLLSVITSDIWK